MDKCKVKHPKFSKKEFRQYYDDMHVEILVRLPIFRRILKYPVIISPASGSIGRLSDEDSYHSITRHGCVMAIDVIPAIREPRKWIRAAELAGFTGIGLYRSHIHLDVRFPEEGSNIIATWGKVPYSEELVGISEALEYYEKVE